MQLTERITHTLLTLPPSPLLDRAVVVDTFLDLLNDTVDLNERQRLEGGLRALPSSMVVDRMVVADALLDVLIPEAPSQN